MPARINIVGKKYGSLLVLSEAESRQRSNGYLRRRSLCQCDCGIQIIVMDQSLRSGHTVSCGCYRSPANITHGHSVGGDSKTMIAWRHMHQRCGNPKDPHFHQYGGRGITVCERWFFFPNFLEDMGLSPVGLTLERLDNSKGYEKANCAWKSQKEQSRNTRRNVVFTVRGITACLAELIERFQLNQKLVRNRLARGWSIERAFFEPVHEKYSHNHKLKSA